MKFTLFTLIALVSAASAGLSKSPFPQHNPNHIHLTSSLQVKRVDVNVPAMTDGSGNIVEFNAAEVPTRKRAIAQQQQKQQKKNKQ